MTLNPIALIEKLITERGSSAVLLKQLELARDEFAALDRKLSETATLLTETIAKNKQLVSDNDTLQSKLRDQQQENNLLQKQIRENYEKDHGRNEHQTQILRMLGKNGKSVNQIVEQPGIAEELVVKHLIDLCSENCVRSPHYMPGSEEWSIAPCDSMWYIQQAGRRYLTQNSPT